MLANETLPMRTHEIGRDPSQIPKSCIAKAEAILKNIPLILKASSNPNATDSVDDVSRTLSAATECLTWVINLFMLTC